MLGLALAFAGNALAASDWQIVKVGNREYLTLENVARFYKFPPEISVVGKAVRITSSKYDLRFQVESREVIINGVRNWMSFPFVEQDGKFLIPRLDLSKLLDPQLRPQMIAGLGKIGTVVLDPGHGGFDKGAVSSYGYEKDYALDVAKQLKPLLESRGLRVVMTRDSDVFIPLEERARIANANKDAIFVSLHFNATDADRSANGFEIYSFTPRGAPSTYDDYLQEHFFNMQNGSPVDNASHELATSIYHSMLGHMSEFDRGIKRARFAVLRLTKLPAVLVEGGFMTERTESQHIAQRDWRGKLADAICVGVDNFKTLAERKQRPMLLADYRREKGSGLLARNGPPVMMGQQIATKPTGEVEASPTPPTEVALTAATMPTPNDIEPSPIPQNETAPITSSTVESAIAESATVVTNSAPTPPPDEPDAATSEIPSAQSSESRTQKSGPPKPQWWAGPFHFQP